MKTTPLLPLQRIVADWYQEGHYGYLQTQEEAAKVNSELFQFQLSEAATASGPYDYAAMLRNTIGELEILLSDVEKEVA